MSYSACQSFKGSDDELQVITSNEYSNEQGESLVKNDLQKLEKELKRLHETNSSVFGRILDRINGVDNGKPIRLGGEEDVAPDGNLRYPGLASKKDVTSIPLILDEKEEKEEKELIAKFRKLAAWREITQAFARGYTDKQLVLF